MKRGFKIKYQGKKDWKDFVIYYKKYREKLSGIRRNYAENHTRCRLPSGQRFCRS